LPQPIPQLRLSKLRKIVHSLFTKINPLQLGNILRRRLANSLHNNRRIRFEDNSIIDNLVNSQGNEVIVFNYSALIY
jgi:hypothetical protein